MTTVPARPFPPESSDLFIYGSIQSADTPLLRYQQNFSLLRRIRKCAPFQRCNLPICDWCSSRFATRAQRAVMARMPTASKVRTFTLTIEDVSDITEGFERLAAVRAEWERRIKNRTSAFYTSTELTDNDPLWHWHLHPVVYGDGVTAKAVIDMWLESAHDLGIHASRRGQMFKTKTPEDAVTYALKPRLGPKKNPKPHTLRGLGTLASQGDADADDRWTEIENFYLEKPRRRWRSSWVAKPSTAPRTTASTFDYKDSPDLRRLVLLDFLGVSSKRAQADVMTSTGNSMSTATISRMRRHDLMAGRAAPPKIDN